MCCCCAVTLCVAVCSFFEGAVLAKPSPSLIVAPPLFSRGLWLLLPYSHVYAMFWSLPFFVFCFEVQRKKKRCTVVGCLQAGSRLSPQLPSESNQCYAVYFERDLPCFFASVYSSSAERTVHDKKKECAIHFGSCIFLYIPRFQRKENKKKSLRTGRGAFSTCAKHQGLISQKWCVHLDFVP